MITNPFAGTTMSENVIHFKYSFVFENGDLKTFEIAIDQETLSLHRTISKPYPAWTRLSNVKCPNCPLSEQGPCGIRLGAARGWRFHAATV